MFLFMGLGGFLSGVLRTNHGSSEQYLPYKQSCEMKYSTESFTYHSKSKVIEKGKTPNTEHHSS